MKIIFVLFLAAFGCKEVKASELKDMSPIGPHYPIITFEKNENPQNIMVIYTKLDKDCKFVVNPDNAAEPVFDFYWLMDKKNYKPVHSMIKSGIHDRMQLQAGSDFTKDRNHFTVKMNDLKELKTDIQDATMNVSAKKLKDKCDVQAEMKLGAADKNSVLKIETIYSEAEKTITPPFRKVTSVTLIGKNETSGQEMKKKFTSQ